MDNLMLVIGDYIREIGGIKVFLLRLAEVPDIRIKDFFSKVVKIVNQILVDSIGFHQFHGPGSDNPGVHDGKGQQTNTDKGQESHKYH
jgi:hypothetical protein